MKQLKRYYFYVGLPILCVALGAIVFFQAIANTVKGNPHPQINYIIFGLIVVGCIQMAMHVKRINAEGALFYRYRDDVRKNAAPSSIAQHFSEKFKSLDIFLLLQLIEALRGKQLNSVQHNAVEAELERFAARQQRRLMVSNFLSGMMVGMGLLGTFIGLLGALAEIGKLIGSFDISAGMDNPIEAISQLVTRLTTPMQAMGVAFSASLFGVLGSLIMGALMVGVKAASSDLVSLVQSGTSFMLDISDHEEGSGVGDVTSIADALESINTHSPLLHSLAVALDQSERRVRDLSQNLNSLISSIENNNQITASLISRMSDQNQLNETTQKAIGDLQANMSALVATQNSLSESNNRIGDMLQQYGDMMQSQIDANQTVWSDHSKLQRDLLLSQAEVTQRMLNKEHEQRSQQLNNMASAHEAGLEIIARHLNVTQELTADHASKLQFLISEMSRSQDATITTNRELSHLMQESNQILRADSQGRTLMMNQMQNLLEELKYRNEQVAHMISQKDDTTSVL